MTRIVEVAITSPPDRNYLVAELWVGGEQMAEVNQEGDAFAIEIYPARSGKPWSVALDALQEALTVAQEKLRGRGNLWNR